jgi:biotin carboxyl carrier protein
MNEYRLRIGNREYRAEVRELTAERARVLVDDTEYEIDLVELAHRSHAEPVRPAAPAAGPAPQPRAVARAAATPHGTGTVAAPLPGLVLDVKVTEGAMVQAGDVLVVMEAMKMENVVPAPHTGTVRRVFAAAGDTVGEGDPLVEISRPEMTTL